MPYRVAMTGLLTSLIVLSNTHFQLVTEAIASCDSQTHSNIGSGDTEAPREVIITFSRGTSIDQINRVLANLKLDMNGIALNRIVRATPAERRSLAELRQDASRYKEVIAVEPNYSVQAQ